MVKSLLASLLVLAVVAATAQTSSCRFTINYDGNQNGNTVEIYNVMGEQVYESVINNSQPTINLNTQPAGMYFVYLKSGKGVEVGRVLVTK